MKSYKNTFLLLLLTFCFALFAMAQEDGKENTKFGSKMNAGFSKFQDSQQKSFDNFREQQQKAFEKFKESISKKWGTQNFLSSSKTNWVEYSDDQESRSLVNFKEGTATVEIIVEPEEAEDTEVIKQKMTQAVEDLSKSKGKIEDLLDEDDPQNQLSEEVILKDQFIDENGTKIDDSNSKEFAEKMVEEKEIEKQQIKGEDGKDRVLLSVSIPLAPDYLQKRAENILPIVTKYAREYQIEPALILAVIHIESYFNPKAISHANAIGLMQLVPSSGGLDAYRYVYGEDKVPSHFYLFNPENNIHLGTAYLQKLMTVYFKNLDDYENKLYCSIASYNTGVGNVCYAVTRTTKISPLIAQLNTQKPQYTYNYLHKNLEYEEARNYLQKVNEKYLMYQGWMK